MKIRTDIIAARVCTLRASKGEGYAPTAEEALAAARTGRLFAVDTASAGEDALVIADTERDALAEVASYYSDEAGCSLDAADWAEERGWLATQWEAA